MENNFLKNILSYFTSLDIANLRLYLKDEQKKMDQHLQLKYLNENIPSFRYVNNRQNQILALSPQLVHPLHFRTISSNQIPATSI